MGWWWLVPVVVAVGAGVVVLAWRPFRRFGQEVQIGRAREMFLLQRERLESSFIKAASSNGKPRGLRWKDCQFQQELQLGRDRKTGEIVALVEVTIRFEAIEGSDMEGLPAVGNLRNASAVFYFHRGQWHTVGKTVFNMSPTEALEHFKKQYEHIDSGT